MSAVERRKIQLCHNNVSSRSPLPSYRIELCNVISCIGDKAGGGNGVGTNFGVGVGQARPEGPRAGDGVLEKGTASPLAPTHQLGGLRERCKLPQRGPRRSPGCRRVFLYSEPSDCLSQHLSIRVAYSLHG